MKKQCKTNRNNNIAIYIKLRLHYSMAASWEFMILKSCFKRHTMKTEAKITIFHYLFQVTAWKGLV